MVKRKGKAVDDPEAADPRLITEEEATEEQGEAPSVPLAVRDGWMQVNYLRPHFERDKEGERHLALEFSMPLTDAHKDVFCAQIEKSWKSLVNLGNKRLDVLNLDGHVVDIGLGPGDSHIHSPAWFDRCSISMVEEKGKGETRTVIRLQFRLDIELTATSIKFAVNQFGETIWIQLAESQGKL